MVDKFYLFFVIYVFCFFPFTVRMGNFCASHFVR